MDPAWLDVLDKALFAGGKNLSQTAIAPRGRGGTTLLKNLCDAGYLKKNNTKYSVTSKGEKTWRDEASEERKQSLEKFKEDQRKQKLVELLRAVEKRDGRTRLTDTEKKKYAEELGLAAERKLITPIAGSDKYQLLPSGKEFLLASMPPEEQLAQIRERQQELQTRWKAANKTLRQDLNRFTKSNGNGETLIDELDNKVEEARKTYETSLKEWEAFSNVIRLAQELEETVLSSKQSTIQKVQESLAQMHSLEHKIHQETEKQEKELEEFRQQTEPRIQKLMEQLSKTKNGNGNQLGPSPANPRFSESDVWEATQQAFRELKRKDDIVIIPEITDEVKKKVAGLSTQEYHERLKEWQREDKLVLQICNTPAYEERAAEGINTNRGLLYYVQMR